MDYREVVYRTLRQMKHDVVAMEDYVAADERPLARCLTDVEASDIYVGIFAWRYGYAPPTDNPDQLSITELEYRHAVKRGKTCLLFLLDPKAHWPKVEIDHGEAQTRIHGLRRELEKDRLVAYFKNPDELATRVSVAVGQWERAEQVPRVHGFWERCREWLAATIFAPRNTKRYLRNLVAEHREFTFLGRAKPLELENIYVSLKVGEHTPRALRPDEHDAMTFGENHVTIVAGRMVEVSEALSLSRRLVVLGDPGSGKTTLLKYLVLQLAQRDVRLEAYSRALIPTLSTRLLEPICRFLSGASVSMLGKISALIALGVWLVQAFRYDMTLTALGAWALFLIFFLFIRLSRGMTIFGAALAFGLLGYAGWWEPRLVGPIAVWLMGISVGIHLYPYWIQPLLALLSALLRRATRYPLPIYLTLNNIARDKRPVEEHLTEAMSEAGFTNPRALLGRKLLRGECVLLLDALDEVVETEVQQRIVSEINRIRHVYGAGNQVLVTSRIAGFRYSLTGYLQLEVQDFNQAQVERFVRSWFADTEDPVERAQRIDGLLRGLGRSPRMRLLASNPLLLSLMTLLYEQNWRLPERRVELYEECTALLIEKWDQFKSITRASRFSPQQKRRALVGIAVHFHEAGTRVFEWNELLATLEAVLPACDGEDESPSEFMDELMAHTGLLRQKSRSTYDFVHLTFQEFFTAYAYLERGDPEALIGHVREAWWQEVIRLYAALQQDATTLLGRLAKEDLILAAGCLADCRALNTPAFRQAAEAIVEDLKRIVREDPAQRQKAADALAEIAGWGGTRFLSDAVAERDEHPEIALAALIALAHAADDSVLDMLMADLGAILRLLHAQLPVASPSLRPRILSLLERLGHPLVFVPAGEFLMGEERHFTSWKDQRPQHSVTLAEYWVDKYPVTNEQYAHFVKEADAERNVDWRKAFTPGKEKHPVVYVNWDDARAYGEWCGKRLPTEAEWEKAARSTDGRTYPWGNHWAGNKSNVSGRGTTPVGQYPAGVSPYGCHDMAGNVDEWVADWYDAGYYGGSPRDNPQGPATGTERVLRGGSWQDNPVLARTAYRYQFAPNFRGNHRGVRLVCAPHLLEALITECRASGK